MANLSISRVPKWAWIASGGVIVGSIGVKYLKNRQAAQDMSAPTDSTSVADQGLTNQSAGGATSVLVPPVVVGGQQDLPDMGSVSDLQQGYLSSFNDLFGNALGYVTSVQDFLTGQQQQTLTAVSTGAAITGSAYDQSNSAFAQYESAIQAILSNTGGGAASSPAPTGVVAAPPAPSAPASISAHPPTDPCPGTKYPFKGPHGCYQVVCMSKDGPTRSKGRWHVYSDGTELKVDNSC